MEDNGHEFGPECHMLAMVYFPEAKEVDGETHKERVDNAESLAMSRAKVMATAPRLYRALEALLDAASIDKTAPEFIEARAALKAARGEE